MKKILIKKIDKKDKLGLPIKVRIYKIIKTKKEVEAEQKKQRSEELKPYLKMTKIQLIDKIIAMTKDIKDLSYQIGDLEDNL
jgi:hypothetical protein